MYLVFLVRPYTKKLPRAIQKPPKVYFYDNADAIGDEGAIFENLVATSLLKKIHFLEDSTGYRYELNYVRDKEGHEVDFAVVKDGTVSKLVEAKWSDPGVSKNLLYFSEKIKQPRAIQVVGKIKTPYHQGKLSVVRAEDYLAEAFDK